MVSKLGAQEALAINPKLKKKIKVDQFDKVIQYIILYSLASFLC